MTELYKKQGEFKKGIVHLRQVLPLLKDWRDTKIVVSKELACLLAASGEFEESMAIVRSLVDEFPGHRQALIAYVKAARFAAIQGRHDLESELLSELADSEDLSTLPEGEAVLNNLAFALDRSGAHKESIETRKQFAEIFPDHANKLSHLFEAARAHFESNELDEAESLAQDVLKHDPDRFSQGKIIQDMAEGLLQAINLQRLKIRRETQKPFLTKGRTKLFFCLLGAVVVGVTFIRWGNVE